MFDKMFKKTAEEKEYTIVCKLCGGTWKSKTDEYVDYPSLDPGWDGHRETKRHKLAEAEKKAAAWACQEEERLWQQRQKDYHEVLKKMQNRVCPILSSHSPKPIKCAAPNCMAYAATSTTRDIMNTPIVSGLTRGRRMAYMCYFENECGYAEQAKKSGAVFPFDVCRDNIAAGICRRNGLEEATKYVIEKQGSKED